MDLGHWLDANGLGKYTWLFAENGVDLNSLHLLTDGDLEQLGVLLGHCRMLLKAIAESNGSLAGLAGRSATASTTAPRDARSESAERRQLTIMFCDLVDSTELSQKLDPETLRELMRAYQKTCGQVIEKCDGHVAQYLGDGLMVYFGWPRAHEDDAERAIRAGLEIVEAVKEVPAPEPLHVRVSIATGPAVVCGP